MDGTVLPFCLGGAANESPSASPLVSDTKPLLTRGTGEAAPTFDLAPE
jgi:hypothetical protein